MTTPTKTRWYQFDLRTLFLLTAVIAAFLAWRLRPQPKVESPIAKSLKAGDQVMIVESGGMYTIAVQGDPPQHRRHALWGMSKRWRPLTVEHVDNEIVRLRDEDQTEVLRISRIARVVRFDAASKGTGTTAAASAGGGSAMNAAGNPLAGGVDAGGGSFRQPSRPAARFGSGNTLAPRNSSLGESSPQPTPNSGFGDPSPGRTGRQP